MLAKATGTPMIMIHCIHCAHNRHSSVLPLECVQRMKDALEERLERLRWQRGTDEEKGIPSYELIHMILDQSRIEDVLGLSGVWTTLWVVNLPC